MSLSSALTSLYGRLKYGSIPATAVTSRLTLYLNKAQQAVLAEIGGTRLVHGTVTFASITSQPEYGLPPSIARVISIRDVSHRLRLGVMGEDEYRSWLADPASDTGTPNAYVALGIGSVSLRPSAADAIFVISDNAADTAVVLNWELVTSAGQTLTGTTTLNGLTGVQLGTLSTIAEIGDIWLTAAAVGTVTIRQTSAVGTVLSTIYPTHSRERFQRVALVPTPSAAVTYTVDCERDALDLVAASDDFPVPVRFADCVEERALMYELADMGDVNRFTITKSEYARMLGLLNDYLVNPPDRVYIPGGQTEQPSNLPGNYATSQFGRP